MARGARNAEHGERGGPMTAAATSTVAVDLYGSRPIRRRRSNQLMIDLKTEIMNLLAAENPMTCRQLYYRLVSSGAIEKTEQEYKGVIRLLGNMRRDRQIPFTWLADSTRWMRRPKTYDSMNSALEETAQFYRRDLWVDQDAYVEIWLEKEALAGVLVDVTDNWHVPLMVTRGYPSISFLHTAGDTIASTGKPAFIYYFGDLDPSGMDISRTVETGLREFASKARINFERVAVTRQQVEEMGLQTRPTKKTDTRSQNFRGESVEVDAIPSTKLRHIAAQCILRHLDDDRVAQCTQIEQMERETMRRYFAQIQELES